MVRRNLSFALTAVIIFMMAPVALHAQKVRAEVTVILERLPMDKRERMMDFQDKITAYINNYDWCEPRYDSELPIKMQIYLQDASVSFEERYRATLIISNNSDMQFYDKRWLFNYDPQQILEHDETRFHPLTSVIDFYINIFLGGEFDKYGKFEGTPFYNKARKISHQARFSRFIFGWDERQQLIDEILAEENKAYREALDAYFLGLAYQEEDFGQTLKYCKKAIDLLAGLIQKNPDYKLPHQFIDGHYIEIIDLFKDSDYAPEVFKTLIAIDPDHKEEYEKYL
jgi:hypothetical protein